MVFSFIPLFLGVLRRARLFARVETATGSTTGCATPRPSSDDTTSPPSEHTWRNTFFMISTYFSFHCFPFFPPKCIMPTTHRNHDLLPGTSFPSNRFPAHSAGKSPRFLCMASQQPTHPKKINRDDQTNISTKLGDFNCHNQIHLFLFLLSFFFLPSVACACMHAVYTLVFY